MKDESKSDDEIANGADSLHCASGNLIHNTLVTLTKLYEANKQTQTSGSTKVMPNGSSNLWEKSALHCRLHTYKGSLQMDYYNFSQIL